MSPSPFRFSSARMISRGKLRFLCALALCLPLAGLLGVRAQQEPPQIESRFTMGRIRFGTSSFGGLDFYGRRGGGAPWSHDWPRSEEHLMKIMAEVTKLDVNPEGKILSFESDEVFKYPIAYLCEVGYLDLTDKEAQNMGEYLLRGGFLIVDDFRGDRALENFRRQMKLVFPDRSLEELPRTHAIWSCFYDITKIFPIPPYSRFLTPQYLGISDDKGRLMMVVDFNNDLSDYWEWSDNPLMPIEQSNEAYQYGVNYLMYALTH